MNVLSLFDGMSCGQISLNRAGIKYNNYYASEIDKHAIKVTQHNYPDTVQLGDVQYINYDNLPKIDLLIGGSPCQSFSFSGKQKGMVTVDSVEIHTLDHYLQLKENNFQFEGQSYLFWEFVLALKKVKPTYFLLENVRMSKKWKTVLSETVGVEPVLIDSSLVSAQQRKRLYWTNIPCPTLPNDRSLVLEDILEDNVPKKYNITDRFYKKKEGTLSFKKSRSNIRTIKEKSKTLLTGGHMISNTGSTNIKYDDNFIRIPTPTECERLQTVPDNYTNVEGLLDSHRYKMLGNGWTVDVIAHIFKGINFSNRDKN